MPSVGMRRSTRVFGARVLRSGRRLSTARHDGSKNVIEAHGESKWTELLDKSADGGGDASDCYKDVWQENENNDSLDVTAEPTVEGSAEVKNVDKRYGIVYKRKRERIELRNTGLTVDKRYGKKFARKQWRNQCRSSESFEICGVGRFQEFVLVVNESAYDCGYWISCLLTSVLSYMMKVRIRLRQLSAFLLSKPIFDAYCSCGVLFLQDSVTTKNPGTCVISGSRSLIPLFFVSSSAIPTLFMHLQTSMHLRFTSLACVLAAHSLGVYEEDENVMDVANDDHQHFIAVAPRVSPGFISHSHAVASDNDRELSHSAPGLPKSALRSIQTRNSRKIQKRRSSLRCKRGRPPLAFQAQKTSGALSSGAFKCRQEGVKVSAGAPSHVLGSLDKRSSTAPNKELKSILGVLMRDAHANSCSAYLLVSESDKCYREEGATVSLESSASNQWFVTVSTNGTKRYRLAAQKVMRPSCNNRFTHSIIWTSDVGWKLEFPNKQDWLIFKELYKECYERNMQSPATSVIPVPRVQEVSTTVDTTYLPYVRPDSYITMKDDELIRALARKTANYDMDSDDEMWLEKLNEELCAGREQRELITPDSFELIVDALEKGSHCNPDEHLDEQVAYDFSMHLERSKVIEAIRNYWIKKRKQNRSALVRIFQLYQLRRTQGIPRSVLRKKRSLKRQASQGGRGKQRPLWQAIAAEQDASEQNAHKQQEAKAAAERSEGLAIQKRKRAQMLVENADLATYKALMALRIAEAAQIAKSPDTVSSFFLG